MKPPGACGFGDPRFLPHAPRSPEPIRETSPGRWEAIVRGAHRGHATRAWRVRWRTQRPRCCQRLPALADGQRLPVGVNNWNTDAEELEDRPIQCGVWRFRESDRFGCRYDLEGRTR